MKLSYEAKVLPDGSIEPAHVVEQVCIHCQDPVSEKEAMSGVCSSCNMPWEASQSVTVTVTSMPAIQGLTISIG
jgi:hypothetical protein